ncbi:MAG: hypothetical protein ACNS63_07630 [Candidatus Nitrospinota bacterium M3_3B_026]
MIGHWLFAGAAYAMPNYARDAGVSCFSCHSKPAKELGAASILPAQETGSRVYSVPVGGVQAGLSIHKTPGIGGESKTGLAGDLSFSDIARDNALNGGEVTGLSGVVNSENFMASLSLLKPNGSAGDAGEDSLALRYRFAFTPRLGGIDFTFGLFGESRAAGGVGSLGEGDSPLERPRAFGLDAGMGGWIGSVTLDLKAMYVNSRDGELFTGKTTALGDTVDGYGAAAEVGFDRKFGLSAAYRTYKGRNVAGEATEDMASIGAWVSLSGDTTLESQYTAFGSDRKFFTDEGAFTLLFITGF